VVLGGTSITGGRGTVIGTILAVILVVVITNSLILLGISPFWQQAMLGILILIGTGIPALRDKRKKKNM